MSLKKNFFLFVFLTAALFPCFGEIITRTDGDITEAASLTFQNGKVSYTAGSGTLFLEAEKIRDISFTGEKQNIGTLATDGADLAGLYKRAIDMQNKYPDSAAITVLDNGESEYRKDGTRKFSYRCVLFIAKEEAMGAAGISLSFDPDREKIKLIHARSYSPDGKITDLNTDQIKISKSGGGSVFFDNYREIGFSIPNSCIGGLIDYSYESEEYNPFDKKLWEGVFFFQGNEPVCESRITVRVPKEVPLYYKYYNFGDLSGEPQKKEQGDYIIYEWCRTDLPPIIPEPFMPPSRDIMTTVAYSIQKDWKYKFERLQPMFKKRFVITDAVQKKVDELTAGATSIHEKISRLYLFCQKEIRYISIKGNLSSNQVGHSAEETLKNRYGDCTDKGMLLATMLKCIGVEAYPVGLKTNTAGKAIRDLPIFDSNHCITEVNLEGKRFYLDSTATDYRYPYFRADDHDVSVVNDLCERIDHISIQPPEDNAMLVDRKLELSPDGTVRVIYSASFTGTSEASSRESARGVKPEEYEKQVRAAVSALTPNYTLHSATHSDPLDFSSAYSVRSEYSLNQYVTRSGKYLLFEIPFFKLRFAEVSLAERKYDIVYMTSSLRTDDIDITLPDGFKPKFIPENLKISQPWFDFETTFQHQGNKISVKRKVSWKERVVPVKEYNTYKEALEKIARYTEERIYIEDTRTGGEK
ncbi:MAG: DUF3857 domain-containing protein [Candidatus Riflebacteria bacterium]|nr:DUF3857 domain-containing protein [Candidatus Riflebacteria bacterium]